MQSGRTQRAVTAVIRAIKRNDKVSSGFSSEDLFSNLIAFYSIVDNKTPEAIIGNKNVLKEDAQAIWKNGNKFFPGYKKWTPFYHPAPQSKAK